MEPEYWATPGRTQGTTEIHCTIGDFARAVAVLDGTPDEVYNLPDEVLEAVKDRLYAICLERYEIVRRSFEDASPQV